MAFTISVKSSAFVWRDVRPQLQIQHAPVLSASHWQQDHVILSLLLFSDLYEDCCGYAAVERLVVVADRSGELREKWFLLLVKTEDPATKPGSNPDSQPSTTYTTRRQHECTRYTYQADCMKMLIKHMSKYNRDVGVVECYCQGKESWLMAGLTSPPIAALREGPEPD